MGEVLGSGPIELLDIDFRDYVHPPAASFADTMRQRGGWGRPSQESLDAAPFLADVDPTEEHIDQMLRFAADAYSHFGGGADKLPFGATYEQVLAYVGDLENQDRFMVYGFEEEIANLAYRYLNGQGEDYESFHEIVELNL